MGGVINDTITFYINNVEYKSPKGYTFAQWVNTSYNYNGWYKNSNRHNNIENYNTNTYIYNDDGSAIVDGKRYTTKDIMISFMIGGDTYDAKIGSTWRDWINGSGTATPTHPWTIYNNKYLICEEDNCHLINSDKSTAEADDKIIENAGYLTSKGITLSTDFSTLSVGSTFKLGKYQVESETPWSIEWEIVHQTDNYQIAMTKQIIDLRCFDGKESTNTDSNRRGYGNNNWQYSNIEQFLNSDQASWYSAQHQYDAPPSSTNVSENYNPYDTHKGFLYHWSNEDKALLKDMTLTLANNTKTDGGGSYTWTGKVFLPTHTQMGFGQNNSIAEGTKFSKFTNNTSRIKSINKYCAENNKWCIDRSMAEGTNWRYWMSSAVPSYPMFIYEVSDGESSSTTAYISSYGLAPCICLSKTGILWNSEIPEETPASKTWRLGRYPLTNGTVSVNFKTKDGKSCTKFKVITEQPDRYLYYTINGNDVPVAECKLDTNHCPVFSDDNYATITFDEIPTGTTLSWIKKIADPVT